MTMAINLKELTDRARQIDCVSFTKRRFALRLPKNKFEGFDLPDLEDLPISKQSKIKLITKNQ